MHAHRLLAGCLAVGIAADPSGSPQPEASVLEAAARHMASGNYPQVLRVLQPLAQRSRDPQVFFLLGAATHFLLRDYRPLPDYGQATSDQALAWLRHALSLDPGHAEARYLLGAEYGSRAWEALRRGDRAGMRAAMMEGSQVGAFPEWLVEYARTMLHCCPQDAVLFVGGDAEVNPILFLQLVEGCRPDVTTIPVALLHLPWYVEALARGLEGAVRPVATGMTHDQVFAMRAYKWKAHPVQMPPDPDSGEPVSWLVEPDLSSPTGTFLSASKAVVLGIVEANRWERPVCFSVGVPPPVMAGLEPSLQLSGLVWRLRPWNVRDRGDSLDVATIERVLLNPDNFRHVSQVTSHPLGRVGVMLNNSRTVLVRLADHYASSGNPERAMEILNAMNALISQEACPLPEPLREEMDRILRRSASPESTLPRASQ